MQDSFDKVSPIDKKGAGTPSVSQHEQQMAEDARIELSPPEVSDQPLPHRRFPEITILETENLQMNPARRHKPTVLPGFYGATRIVLQVRDPFWMHAYWEIAEDMAQNLRRQLGEELDRSQLTLRVHDVTGVTFDGHNSVRSFDKEVHPFANNWYINVEESDRSYCVDLGLVTGASQFYLISRSNTVHTPRIGPSWIVDEEWLTIREIEEGYISHGLSPSSPGISRHARAEELLHEIALGSGGVGAVGSPMGQPGEVHRAPRGFWLRADAELIVHGATEAGAKVEVCGMPMPVRPDGSFSVRLSLPFGDHPVDISATSDDGIMHRSVSWIVSRSNRGNGRS